MNQLINTMMTCDREEIEKSLREFVNQEDLTVEELISILEQLPSLVNRFTDSFSVDSHGSKILWYRYESLIWSFGEAFRQILSKNKKLRSNPTLFRLIEEVCLNTSYAKGRESFTMLLGQYGGKENIPALIQLLKDEIVCGHAVYSLRLLKASEAKESVKPFLESKKTWIRNEAKKYFEKVK